MTADTLFWSERHHWIGQAQRAKCGVCRGAIHIEAPSGLQAGRLVCSTGAHEFNEIRHARPVKVDPAAAHQPVRKGRPPGVRSPAVMAEARRARWQPGYTSKPDQILAILRSRRSASIDELADAVGSPRKGITRFVCQLRDQGHGITFADGCYVLVGRRDSEVAV